MPQIVALLAGKSAAGVSLLANLQELFVYTVIMSRAVRLAYPFRLALSDREPKFVASLPDVRFPGLIACSTWGEAFFIELQLLALVGIILYYNGRLFFFLPVLAAVAGVMYAVSKPGTAVRMYCHIELLSKLLTDKFFFSRGDCGGAEWVSKELLMNLQYYTVPIMLMSRLTQIVAVVRAKATGEFVD